MNDFLVGYLVQIDEKLVEYLDDDHELRLDTVWRMEICAGALLDESITPGILAEDWPEWFVLVRAFVAAYGPEVLEALEAEATLLNVPDVGDGPLTKEDSTYLEALVLYLDNYTESRSTTG